MRKIGTDGRDAALPEMHAQDPGNLAERQLGVETVLHDRTHRQRMAETQQRVPALEQGREKLAGAPGNIPVLGKQDGQPGLFPFRRPAPVDTDRNQAKLLAARLDAGPDQSLEPLRAAGALAAEQETLHAAQDDDPVGLLETIELER